jgi:hypothetical protein
MLPAEFVTLVGPAKKRRGITKSQLDALARGSRPPLDRRVSARLEDLERRVAELEGRVDVLARDKSNTPNATAAAQ